MYNLKLECAVDCTSSQIPAHFVYVVRRTDGFALPHSYYKEKSCGKFDEIPPNGLEEDSVTDRWTDSGRKKMLLSHTLTIRVSDVASLVEFRTVV